MFRIETLSPSHVTDDFVLMVATCFSRNPVERIAGTTAEMLVPFFRAQVAKSLPERCSLVAVDPETQQVLGCALNEDLSTAHLVDYDYEKETEELKVVTQLLEELGEVRASPGEVMRIVALATREGFEGKGIMKALFARSLEVAKELKYQRVTVETANKITKKVVERSGFFLVKTVHYEGFEFPRGSKRYPLRALVEREPEEIGMATYLLNFD